MEKLFDGTKVSVEEFDKFLSQQGVIVIPHIGRLRITFSLPDSIFTKRNNTQFLENIEKGRFSFLTRQEMAKFSKIENQARTAVKKAAIGYDGKYIPIDIYKNEVKPVFEEKIEEYFELRDEVLSNWDERIQKFLEEVEIYFKRMRVKKPVTLVKEIKKQLPTKETYKNSFYMYSEIKAFPVMSNLTLLDESIAEEVREGIKKDAVNSIYDIIGNLLGKTFTLNNRLLKNYKKRGSFTEHEISEVNDLKNELIKKNILKHSKVEEIIECCKDISLAGNEDERAELMEEMLIDIYDFLTEFQMLKHIENDMENLSIPVELVA